MAGLDQRPGLDHGAVFERGAVDQRTAFDRLSASVDPPARPELRRFDGRETATSGGDASMSDSFVHLHVHTEFSMLDGAARLKDLFTEAHRLRMPALAITDHGNLYGAYDFYKQAMASGIKPVIGIESYLTPRTDRRDKTRVRWAEGGENDVSGGGAYTHMTLLAADAGGLRNLFRLASMSSLEGFFYKPRADRELL